MGAGAFIEPLVVVTLLFGGTWINRNTPYQLFGKKSHSRSHSRRKNTFSSPRSSSSDSLASDPSSPSSSSTLLSPRDSDVEETLFFPVEQEPKWRKREVKFLGFRKEVVSPNTRRFREYFLSRLLRKFPFLVEAWYWALIYWVYQLGRAFTAVTLVSSTVDVARHHALQIIHLEQHLHLFFELPIQHYFLAHPILLHWTNRIYSFIHIPGTIAFLVWLYYYTTPRPPTSLPPPTLKPDESNTPAAGPNLYAARRRTMAMCNLLAFIVFTLWPCMPPRLLSDPDVKGPIGDEARSYGFVDTVHGAEGESSVWTQNRFCNQYAAMPSLHFGYSLLIGLTIASIPLSPRYRRSRTITARISGLNRGMRWKCPSGRRLLCLTVGFAYPAVILMAIIATANHFVLDAVAGAMVCGVAWCGNRVLLNLLAVEDYFLWCVRICKPERLGVDRKDEREEDGDGWEK